MAQFIEGISRDQVTLLPESLDDYVAEENPARVVDAFIRFAIYSLTITAFSFPFDAAISYHICAKTIS